jgi:hypothetical protein
LPDLVEGALDDIPSAVGGRVELDGPSAGRAAAFAMAFLVVGFGDDRADPAAE